jgi:hypothetical protein
MDGASPSTPDLYEPYGRLIEITILGRVFRVPENNLLLRQMQYVAPDIGSGRYCWNGECRYCEVEYHGGTGSTLSALACRVKGLEGMKVTKLAVEVKYNMAEALAAAGKAPAG